MLGVIFRGLLILLAAIFAPVAALAQEAGLACAKDDMWKITVRFDDRLVPEGFAPSCFNGAWDCISEATKNPDIRICFNGQCTDIDEATHTRKPCRDTLLCVIEERRIGGESVVFNIADDDALGDDRITPIEVKLRKDLASEADRKYNSTFGYGWAQRFDKQFLTHPAFAAGKFIAGVAVFLTPTRGWVTCPARSPADRIIKGVDVIAAAYSLPDCGLALDRQRFIKGLGAITQDMRGFSPFGASPGVLLNLAQLKTNAEVQKQWLATPIKQWSDATWEMVIDAIDWMPEPETFKDSELRKNAANLKSCLRG